MPDHEKIAEVNKNRPLIKIQKDKCRKCYACVRVCPVKAIKIEDGSAIVMMDRCIGCGNCLRACHSDAIVYRDSKNEVKSFLNSDKKNVAIVAPSISGEFSDIRDYRKFVSMIRELGFDYVNEVAFGADIVAFKYLELFHNSKGKYYITTNCPVVVAYVEKYQPELLDNLAPIVSPMIATAKIARDIYGPDAKITYIGPCIQAKNEAMIYRRTATVNSVLTFMELRELFQEKKITENSVEYSEFDYPLGGKGSLFPISRGMFQSVGMNEDLLTGNILITEGKDNFLDAIKEFSETTAIDKHMDIFPCEGCIMGPGTSPNGKKFLRRTQVIDYVNKRMKDFDQNEWHKNIAKYIKSDYSCKFDADDQRLTMPTEERINEILKAMSNPDKSGELGCGSCGYESCRELAIAIAQGIARYEMCLPFTIRKLTGYANRLHETNEKLAATKEALKESEEIARKEQLVAKEASKTTSAMLQKLPSGVVIVDRNLKIMESNKSFINILGKEAQELNEIIPGLTKADLKTLIPFHKIFSSVLINGENILNRDVKYDDKFLNVSVFNIRKGEIVGAIIRDMSTPEVRRDEVIKRAEEVIKENLASVQQIAFLLGESASKTEKTLNSIIESHKGIS